jgi:hypothetical protein
MPARAALEQKAAANTAIAAMAQEKCRIAILRPSLSRFACIARNIAPTPENKDFRHIF